METIVSRQARPRTAEQAAFGRYNCAFLRHFRPRRQWQNTMKIDYAWLPGTLVQDPLLEECSELFSAHYGLWSRNDPQGRGGRPVKFSKGRIRRLLASP